MLDKLLTNKTVGIVGGGTIGRGLIKLFIRERIKLVVFLRNGQKVKALEAELRQYQQEKFPHLAASDIKFTTEKRKLAGCDFIIEAIDEDFTKKARLYRRLRQIIGKTAVVATTTSSLSINKLAAASGAPERFVGLHFFNPPHYIKFIEVIPSKNLLPEFLTKATDFIKSIGYECVILPDIPGFVANKILFNMLLAAVELKVKNKIDERIIDSVVKKSLKHPMGPFELLNFIGIDTADKIFGNLLSKNKLSVWKEYYETLNR